MSRYQEPDEQWFIQTLQLQTDLAFKNPSGFTFDEKNDLVVCDTGNSLIRKIKLADGSLNVSTICGILGNKSGKDGTLETASFMSPCAVSCFRKDGTLFVAQLNGSIKRVSIKENSVRTVYSFGGFLLRGMFMKNDGRNRLLISVQDHKRSSSFIAYLRINENGLEKDSEGIKAGDLFGSSCCPNQIAMVGADVYFTCTNNHCIMMAMDEKTLTSFTSCEYGGYKDAYINKAQFCNPQGLVADTKGNLFICDRDNNRIRKVHTHRRMVKTIAGNDKKETMDGFNTQASLSSPVDIVMAQQGVFYVLQGTGEVRIMTRGLPWFLQKHIWIAYVKNSPVECPLASLPRELLRVIISLTF